jgi:hypothetical protein
MEELRCLIPEELLDSLGTLMPGERSNISPLNTQDNQAYNPAQISVLQSLQIVDKIGNPTSPVQAILKVLGKTRAFAKIHLNSGDKSFQYVNYFSQGEEPSVAMISLEEGVELVYPANVSEVLQGLKEYTGESFLRSCDFRVEISLKEGLVFCALLDLRRKAILHSFINSLELAVQAYDIAQIASFIANIPDTPQWLTPVVKMLGELETEFSTVELQNALLSLKQRGLISQNNHLFMLEDAGAQVADQLLIFDNFINLSAGGEDENGLLSLINFTCLQAGVNDLLYLEVYDGQLLLNFISTAMLYGHLHHFLTNGDALRDMPKQPSTLQSNPVNGVVSFSENSDYDSKICQSCNKPLRDGDKFCTHCGAPIVVKEPPKPQICPQCGHTPTPGAKFCGNCGFVLGAKS